MPKAIVFDVDLVKPNDATVTVSVEIDQEQHALAEGGPDGMTAIAAGILAKAAALAAEADLPADGRLDASQLQRARTLYADNIGLKAMRKAGPTKRYEVDAQYSDGQPFQDEVLAVDDTDAAFQVAMTLARNSGSVSGNRSEFDDMLAAMSGVTIFWTRPVGPSAGDVAAVLARLYSGVESGDTEDAMNEAKRMLESLDALPAPGPRI